VLSALAAAKDHAQLSLLDALELTILVARKDDEEVDITVVPPSPPEALAVAGAPDAPPEDVGSSLGSE